MTTNPPGKAYSSILKSTGLVGGGSALNILIGIARTKVFALMLGPSGMGLIGLYQSVSHFASILAGMGINRSGVRQIAEAEGSGDKTRIADTVHALRRVSLGLGLLGALLMVALSVPISVASFGESSYWPAIAFLGIAVMFTAVSDGQLALLQGLRRLGDLVKIRVVGALAGTLLGIPLIWFWREEGIVWMLIGLALTNVCTSWWYARRVNLPASSHCWEASKKEAVSLLRLGLAFMGSGVIAALAAYLIRLAVARQEGMEAAGQFFAAQMLSTVYASFILQAMGSDFYPRLTAVANDDAQCNRMINEQAEIALLLAVPGLLGVMCLAPWIIELFYSSKFGTAAGVLRWQILGLIGQVLVWPMGFVILAKGKGKLFFFTELASNSVHLLLVVVLLEYKGLEGAGMAFALLYLFHNFLVWRIARGLSGFAWSQPNKRLITWMFPCTAAVFLSSAFLTQPWSIVVGLILSSGVAYACLRGLLSRAGTSRLPEWCRKALIRTRLIQSTTPAA